VSSRGAALLWDPRAWAPPYVAMWFGIGFLPSVGTDLDSTFWPSTKVALAGHPLLVYSVAGQAEYPNANGPLALLPLTAAGLVIRALGWLDAPYPRHATVLAVFSLFVLLMAREGVAAIERLRGHRLQGWKRLLAYATLTLTPPVWQSVEGFGHLEQPIEVWLVLVAVRCVDREWILRAGIAFGLAMLSRSSAVLLSIPLALSLVMRSPIIAMRFFAAAGVTGAAGLLPFYVADRADVIHSLFTYRGALPIGAGSIWSVTRDGALAPVAQRWDILAVVAVALAANLWLATRRGGFTEDRLFAGMTLASASFALLAKTVWPYYFFEVFAFGTIWAAGSWRRQYGFARLLVAPIAISVMGMLAEVGSLNGLPLASVRLEGVAMFLMLGLVTVWIAWRGAGAQLERSGAERDPGMSPA
jgi:hypothetical protein